MKILFFVLLVLSPTLVFADDLISNPAVNTYEENQQDSNLLAPDGIQDAHLCGSAGNCSSKAERLAHPATSAPDDQTDVQAAPSKSGN